MNTDEKAPPRLEPGTGRTETNCLNSISAPAEAQVLIPNFNIDVHGFILMAAEIKELEKRNEEACRALMDRRWHRVRDGIAEMDEYQEKCRQRHSAEVARKKHRQEVTDRLAEAQLELTLLEIEIRRAELAAIKEGGRHV
jgi:hypothetical protein